MEKDIIGGDKVNDIMDCIKDISAVAVILSTFIEISPVKINPLSCLFKKFGKALNSEVNLKVDKLTTELTKLKTTTEENRRKELKIHISNFASDLRHGVRKSESQFIAIIELCDEYLNNNWNSKVRLDAEFIKEEYVRLGTKVKKNEIYIKGDE